MPLLSEVESKEPHDPVELVPDDDALPHSCRTEGGARRELRELRFPVRQMQKRVLPEPLKIAVRVAGPMPAHGAICAEFEARMPFI